MKSTGIVALTLLISALCATSCHPTPESEESEAADVRTPVTVTSIDQSSMSDYIELNATSAYLQKSYLKANANGYVENVNAQIGHLVKDGQTLFSIKTKESQTIGNSVSILDSSLHFSGVNKISASTNGYVTELNHQSGDYVQDGEQLALITNQNSFVFLLNLPYELKKYLPLNKTLELVLPGGEKLSGTVSSMMPSIDSASQTQPIVIRVSPGSSIPENLVASVRLVTKIRKNTISLPKAAILTDEAQTYAWVMKMIDSSTAVKVEVKMGIISNDKVEILSPGFTSADQFLLSGNYGLPDTAKVIIIKENE